MPCINAGILFLYCIDFDELIKNCLSNKLNSIIRTSYFVLMNANNFIHLL